MFLSGFDGLSHMSYKEEAQLASELEPTCGQLSVVNMKND